MLRSALVATLRLFTYRFTNGRVNTSVAAETMTNQKIWSHTAAPSAAHMSATSAPKTNQMDISPAVTASTMTNTMSATTQNTIVPEGGITIITSLAF